MLDQTLIQELKNRGLISQITDELNLVKLLFNKKISIYCGFDITADSLHIGHILPLLCLKRFYCAGHKPVVLIGGATSLIGDPSFKSTERKLNTSELICSWKNKIINQLSLFLEFDANNRNCVIVDNFDWFKNINIIMFLRDIGKYFSINKMIVRDAVQNRINRLDCGISFTEFSYNLLQAYDFAILNKNLGVVLQIGGSDQWGNITSGIELTRKLYKRKVFGMTLPLLTKKDGIKFGKTESDTIWLDGKKTTPYKFYQYWLNIPDSDLYTFLKMFTFLSLSEIEEMKYDSVLVGINKHKKILADFLTGLIHGQKELEAVKRITINLFSGKLCDMKESDFIQLEKDGIPSVKADFSKNLQQILVDSQLALSRINAKNMIVSNSIRINHVVQNNPFYCFCINDRIFNKYTLLSRGKKHFCLLHWV